jgi:hypothetical protein
LRGDDQAPQAGQAAAVVAAAAAGPLAWRTMVQTHPRTNPTLALAGVGEAASFLHYLHPQQEAVVAVVAAAVAVAVHSRLPQEDLT